MKRLIVLGFVVALFLMPAYLFAASCDSAGEGNYITFTFDGEEYTLSYGYTVIQILRRVSPSVLFSLETLRRFFLWGRAESLNRQRNPRRM